MRLGLSLGLSALRSPGSGLGWLPTLNGNQPLRHFDIVADRYWAGGEAFDTWSDYFNALSGTFTRASQAWDKSKNLFASGALRVISGNGLLIERQLAQLLASPLSPATQSLSLSAVYHAIWVEGPGSLTLSGANSGVATEGSPVFLSPAVAGSTTFTVAGTLSLIQCVTPVPHVNAPILAQATKNADALSFPFTEGGYTLVMDAVTASGIRPVSSGDRQTLFNARNASGHAVRVYRQQTNPDSIILTVIDGGGTTNATPVTYAGNNAPARIAVRADALNYGISLNGGGVQKVIARGAITPDSVDIGSLAGAVNWDGYISRMTVFPDKATDSQLVELSTI